MSDVVQGGRFDDDEIDLMALIGKIFARKFTILFITLVALVFGVAYALISPPLYQADALLQLEEKSGGGLAISSELSSLFSQPTQSVTEIEIIRSRMVLGAVVEALDLDWVAAPKRLPVIGDFLRRYDLPYPGWGFLAPYAWFGEKIRLGNLSIPETLQGTPLVLTATGEGGFEIDLGGRPLSGMVGQRLQDEITGFTILVDLLEGRAGRQFLIGQIPIVKAMENLRANLSISEKGRKSSILQLALKSSDPTEAARILRRITEVYLLQNLSRNAAEAEKSLAFLREQLPQAEEKVRLAETALNTFKTEQDSVDLSFETQSVLQQAVEIEAQLNALALQEVELQKRYTKSHPLYQTLLDNRTQLEQQLANLRIKAAQLPETQQDMLRLTQDLEVAREVYLQMVNRAQELNIVKAGTLGNVRIIDTALAKANAVAPNKKLIVLLSGMLGLMAGVGYALLRSFMDKGVRSVEEIEALGIPVYATIPKIEGGTYSGAGKRKGAHDVLAKKDPTNIVVEALRSLRTSLHFGLLDAKSSLCMVTSARPQEGKSFISTNLAVVMAQSGQNICLVDADIRRGYLRRYFGLAKTAPGLTDFLSGEAEIEDVIYRDEESGLYIIPAGKYPPNPSELLMHPRFGTLVDYLNKRFDMSIIDTPPLLAVTDPVIVGKYAGMILLVAFYDVTNLDEVLAAKKTLETNGLKITGGVLNAYDMKKSRYGGYYGASYRYEYKARKG